jgi:acetylornithine deacetylase/succinyl-diaminopimelate desuccinylase-like protein
MTICADLLGALRPRTADILALTAELVAVESGSYDADNVDRVGRIYGARWTSLGFDERVHPLAGRGARRSFHRAGDGHGKLVILGHADTVWPAGSQPGWTFSQDGEHAYGPGVGDMKGGLAMAWFAVDALVRLPHRLPAALVMMLVPDEELGSPGSRQWIENECRDADAVLVLEASRPNGGVVVGRRAVGAIRAHFTGRSAHAAVNHAEGASAVRAAARATLTLDALTDLALNRIVNVGVLRGGAARQVVPPEAELHVDLRAERPEDIDTLEGRVRAILAETGDPRVTVRIDGGWTRPVFPESSGRALYALAERFAREIGAPIAPVVSSGGSDGSFAGAMGRPTLDGLGPICFEGCSRRERIVIASLAERAAIFGALIDAVAERGLR